MKKRDMLCGLLAIVAVVIYMLACGSRPAWSPDSKQVVFSFCDQQGETTGLALYDLPTGKLKRIFESKEEMLFQPLWLGEKEQIVAVVARGEKNVDVIQVDLETGEDRLIKSISSENAKIAMMVPPVLKDDRYLLFSFEPEGDASEMALHRLDLETGKLAVVPKSAEHYLFQFSKGYIYLAAKEGKENEQSAVVLGKLDIEKMKFQEVLLLEKGEYGEIGLGLACKKDSSEFALITMHEGIEEGEKKLVVLIISRRGKILGEIELPADPDLSSMIHMVFGSEDESLWVPIINSVKTEGDKSEDEEGAYRLTLLEVDVEKESYQTVLEAIVEDESYRMQPSISPDGKWLAVEVLMPKEQPRSVLYLVDLTSSERKVTKVVVPAVELYAEPDEEAQSE